MTASAIIEDARLAKGRLWLAQRGEAAGDWIEAVLQVLSTAAREEALRQDAASLLSLSSESV